MSVHYATRRLRKLDLHQSERSQVIQMDSENDSDSDTFYLAVQSSLTESACVILPDESAPWSPTLERDLPLSEGSPTLGPKREGSQDTIMCDTPSLSHSSRSESEDSLFTAHLPSLYSDMSPVPSPSPSSPNTATDEEALEEDADSRILSLPLKVAAFALALLPIPMSFLRGSTPNPPPLPVEHAQQPRTYLPRHRSSSSVGIISPRASTSNLHSLSSLPNLNRPKRKVCFDRVTIISSPNDSDVEEER